MLRFYNNPRTILLYVTNDGTLWYCEQKFTDGVFTAELHAFQGSESTSRHCFKGMFPPRYREVDHRLLASYETRRCQTFSWNEEQGRVVVEDTEVSVPGLNRLLDGYIFTTEDETKTSTELHAPRYTHERVYTGVSTARQTVLSQHRWSAHAMFCAWAGVGFHNTRMANVVCARRVRKRRSAAALPFYCM